MALPRFRSTGFGKDDRPDLSAGWQTVYAGFAMIMLCFFILLTSFSSMAPSKVTRFVSSFSNAVSVLEHGASLEEGETIKGAEIQLLPREHLTAQLFEQVRQASREEGLDEVVLQRTPKGVVLTLTDTLLFASGEARFSEAAYPRLEKIGRLIQRIQVPVEIQGHTDNQPIRTTDFPSNWDLSTARAISVLRHMIQTPEIMPERLSAVGFAEFQPMVANDSAEQRALNRRVDFVFHIEG
ncbi:MAG: flagellar motor protein MotB [Desulfatitalea sp.]|nr:flagellar motor protein MotB [Desulfatitalea sp.]